MFSIQHNWEEKEDNSIQLVKIPTQPSEQTF